jgi:hypothetical protein
VSVGDMHWVDLPAANGREQRGRRPAVVFQDDDYGGELPVVLVVPLTTARAAMRFSGTTLIPSSVPPRKTGCGRRRWHWSFSYGPLTGVAFRSVLGP